MASLFPKIKDAIVEIISASIDNKGIVYSSNATGFFIDETHVVTVAHAVLTSINRSPPSSYYLARVQKIMVVVYYNGLAKLAQANLIGISPINDLAVLEVINPPPHTTLSWGNSRATPIGETAYVLGDLLNLDTRALSSGIVRDNRLAFTANPNVGELIDTNISIGGGISGSPILLGTGAVIGIVSFVLNWLQANDVIVATGTTMGPAQYMLQPIVSDILAGINTVTVSDPLGNWLHWQSKSLDLSGSYLLPLSLIGEKVTPDQLASYTPPPKIEGVLVGTDLGNVNNYLYPMDLITRIGSDSIGYQQIEQMSITTALINRPMNEQVIVTARLASQNYSYTVTVPGIVTPLPNSMDNVYTDAQIALTSNITGIIQTDLQAIATDAVALGTSVASLVSTLAPIIAEAASIVGAAAAAVEAFATLIPEIGAVIAAIVKLAKAVNKLVSDIRGYVNSIIENAAKSITATLDNRVFLCNMSLTAHGNLVNLDTGNIIEEPWFKRINLTNFQILQPGDYTWRALGTAIGPAGAQRHFAYFTFRIRVLRGKNTYIYSVANGNAVHPVNGTFNVYTSPPPGVAAGKYILTTAIIQLYMYTYQLALDHNAHLFVMAIAPPGVTAL
jgi:hypothetical protein